MRHFEEAIRLAVEDIKALMSDIEPATDDNERAYISGLKNAMKLVEHRLANAKELASHDGERLE